MAGENFLIGVDVQLDKATQQITAMTSKTTQGAREAESALEAMGNEAEQAGRQVSAGTDVARQSTERVATASRTTAAATNTMANSFRGAGAAVSGVSATMSAFGGPVGPVATVGSSLAALAASGAGPLAIAVTGLVALAGAFTTVGSEAADARSQLDAINASVDKLNLELRATRAGRGVREQELVEEIRSLERVTGRNLFGPIIAAQAQGFEGIERLSLLRRELSALRSLNEAREKESESAEITAKASKQAADNAERTRREIEAAVRASQIPDRASIEAQAAAERDAYRADVFAQRRAVAQGVARRLAARAGSIADQGQQSIARQQAAVTSAERFLQLDRDERGDVRDVQRIQLEQQLRTEQEILRVVESQVELRRRENEEQRAAQEEQRQSRLRQEEADHFDRLRRLQQQRDEQQAENVRRRQQEEQEAAEQERRALAARFQAPGVQFARGLEQGLSQALQGQLDDPLARLGGLIQQTMADSVAAGIIKGLGVEQAAANLTEGISNFFSAGLGGPSSAPGGAR